MTSSAGEPQSHREPERAPESQREPERAEKERAENFIENLMNHDLTFGIGQGLQRMGGFLARGLVVLVGQATSIRLMAMYLVIVLMLYLFLDGLMMLVG